MSSPPESGREKEGRFAIGVQAIILNDEGKVLLAKRKSVFQAGTWALPGGRLKKGETFFKALRRELLEEHDITVEQKDCQVVCIADPIAETNFNAQIGFLITRYDGELVIKEPKKCEALAWFELSDLPHDLFTASRQLLEKYREGKLY